jgi:membrane dipeptidase
MTDDMIRAMAKKGGVVHINYHAPYLDQALNDYWQKTQPYVTELLARFPGDQNLVRRREETASRFGMAPKVSWERILDHIDHVVKIAGADHVGLGSDFDGITAVPKQLEDVSCYPYITQVLLDRGHSPADIRKILGANVLRVLQQAEAVAKGAGGGKD